jgi:ABC-type bacteriocin/lantibiotic exporter with double-glycine peptidase domain
MLYYLVMIRWWIFPLLIATSAPVFILTVYSSMKEYDTFGQIFPFYRKAQYLSGLITGRNSIKEARLFQYGNFIGSRWETSLQTFHTGQVRANMGPRFLAGFFIILQYAVTVVDLFIIAPSVLDGTLSAGVFIAVAQAMWNLVGGFQWELVTMIKNGGSFVKFRQDYHQFFAIPGDASGEKKQAQHFSTIVLEDIWFQYRQDLPFVLRGVSLTIQAGKKLGIVGENGSGKSTLIKITMGLLAPTGGRILLDGVPITNENRYLLRSVAAVVFQDYGRYNLTLRESLALARSDGGGNDKAIQETITGLHREGDFLDVFEHGLETKLGKDRWDGQDLSGGQWQTLALARAIFAGRPLLVLDEPTAALDPLAEVDVYRHVYHSDRISTALLVTHRLGAITMVDDIWVLRDGMIVEQGSHDRLLEIRGTYANMFETQAAWYTTDSNTSSAEQGGN